MSYPSASNYAQSFLTDAFEELSRQYKGDVALEEEIMAWKRDLAEILEEYKDEAIRSISRY
jgi:hypothetical protein